MWHFSTSPGHLQAQSYHVRSHHMHRFWACSFNHTMYNHITRTSNGRAHPRSRLASICTHPHHNYNGCKSYNSCTSANSKCKRVVLEHTRFDPEQHDPALSQLEQRHPRLLKVGSPRLRPDAESMTPNTWESLLTLGFTGPSFRVGEPLRGSSPFC
jgi:hypothetical protein